MKRYLTAAMGTSLTAFAISVFYTPNRIVNGGVSGIATILFYALNIPTGLSFFVINILLLVLALRVLSRSFVINTIACSVFLSMMVQVFSCVPPITHDIFLATVFGSVLYGIGIGMTLANGASTGGTDIVGRLFQHFLPNIRIGTYLLIVDSTIISISLIVFKQRDLAMYGIVALCVSSFAINRLIQKLNISKLAFVITSRGFEISKKLISTSPRGITIINATGAYTMTDKNVLMCAMKESEAEEFQEKITNIDKEAFVIFSESQQILGNGFRIYK